MGNVRAKMRYAVARRRKGFGLLEIFMGIIIVAVAAVIGLSYYNATDTGRKSGTAANDLGAVMATVRNVYSGSASYDGLANTDIVRSLPSRMLGSGGAAAGDLRHAFGGPINIEAADQGTGGSDNAFSVTFSSLPFEACKNLVTKDFGRAVISMSVNGTEHTDPSTATAADGELECTTDNDNELIWTIF